MALNGNDLSNPASIGTKVLNPYAPFFPVELKMRLNKPHFQYQEGKYQNCWTNYNLVELFDAPLKWIGDDLNEDFSETHEIFKLQREMDIRTGFAFTRLQTLHLREKCQRDDMKSRCFSYGSCIFPTLGFVAERHLARENFEPETVWNVTLNDKVGYLTTEFTRQEHLYELEKAEDIVDICKAGNMAIVKKVNTKKVIRPRPLPLNTAELATNICRLLGIAAEKVMYIAKKLHDMDLISNPRTETNIFPDDLDLEDLVRQHIEDKEWGDFAKKVLEEGPEQRKGDRVDQKARPPIYPKKICTNLLNYDELFVYKFIVRHFLASISRDAVGEETVVEVDIAGEKFVTKGLTISQRNYLDVYNYCEWKTKEINLYQEGNSFTPSQIFKIKTETSPPKLLTEADLIVLMVTNCIGTDSTYDKHIENLKKLKHGYVMIHDNIYLTPTALGLGLFEGYNKMPFKPSLTEPILRAAFEMELRLVRTGNKNAEDVLKEEIAKYRKMFEIVQDNIDLVVTSVNTRLNEEDTGTKRTCAPNPDNCPHEDKRRRTET